MDHLALWAWTCAACAACVLTCAQDAHVLQVSHLLCCMFLISLTGLVLLSHLPLLEHVSRFPCTDVSLLLVHHVHHLQCASISCVARSKMLRERISEYIVVIDASEPAIRSQFVDICTRLQLRPVVSPFQVPTYPAPPTHTHTHMHTHTLQVP